MIGIYKITSPSNSVYIGQSWNIMNRWSTHKHKAKKGNDGLLSASFVKYGVNNHTFEVIHELPNDIDQFTIDQYEQLYIDLYKDCDLKMLNIREAGSNGKLSKETIKKLKSIRGELHHGWGKKRLDFASKITGDRNPRAKCVLQIDHNNNIVGEYKTAKYAELITGIPRSSICRSCKKDSFLSCGYKFNYKK